MKKRVFFILLYFSFFLCSAVQPAWAEANEITDTSSSLDFANGLYARKMYAPAISEYQKFIETNPNAADISSARFRLADSYYFMKEFKQAAENFQNFIRDYPQDKRVPVARFRLGTALFNIEEYGRAEKELFDLAADAQDPTIKSGALFYLAKVYEAGGKVPRMVTVLKRLVLNYPGSEYAAYSAFTLGDLNLKSGNNEEAISQFKNAAQRSTPKALADQAKNKLADIYFDAKDYESAHTYYMQLYESLKTDGKTDEALLNKAILGLLYSDSRLKNADEPLKIYKDNETFIKGSKDKNTIFYLLADIVAQNKDVNLALPYLDAILADPSAEPSLKDSALFKKSRIFTQSSKKDQALTELQKIIDSESKDAPRAYFEKGNLLFEMGKFDEALPYYKMAAEESSPEYERLGLYGLAMTQSAKGDKKEAHVSFEKLFTKFKGSQEAERSLLEATQIDLDGEDYKEATRHSIQFIHAYPKSGFLDLGYYKLAMALTGIGRYKQAAAAFKKITDDFPKSALYAEALYGVGVSFDRGGDLPATIAAYERFLKECPAHSLYNDTWVRLGYIYIQNADFDKAEAVFQSILINKKEIELDSKIALWAIRYLLDKSRYSDMQALIGILKERFPKEDLSHEAEFFTGEAAMGMKDYENAIRHYSKAIELKADGAYTPQSYLGRGVAYEILGKDADAQKNFQEVVRFDSAVEAAARARFEIANLVLKSGNIAEAAKAFMLVAILYDDAKYSPLALYKASECFKNLGQTDEAGKALDELKAKYPNNEWTKNK